MMLSSVRKYSRNCLFEFIRRISETDDARAMANQTLRGLLHWRPALDSQERKLPSAPYAELGHSLLQTQTSLRSDAIIITARFRSGSSLLWNLFRHLDDVTAYYEPFNERRWFDPQSRGNKIDLTHKNIDDYWREYNGLDQLRAFYREEWINRNLYMDATFWDPGMKRYVEMLMEAASGRPVLQFNRIDFRLPWFRQHFPHAKIVHLYRHPRDQWCSSLMNPTCFPASGKMSQFHSHDKFYLLSWAKDLRYHFPFLNEDVISHPYQMFYYIWKLSYIFGVRYADYSLSFENLVSDTEQKLIELFRVLNIEKYGLERLQSLVEKPPTERWKAYADDAWFRSHETLCETVLAEFWEAVTV
jgi:hypothetical protein